MIAGPGVGTHQENDSELTTKTNRSLKSEFRQRGIVAYDLDLICTRYRRGSLRVGLDPNLSATG
jgi:hypothetical protein